MCVAIAGSAMCWGQNSASQLGSATMGSNTGTSKVPVIVATSVSWIQISAGGDHVSTSGWWGMGVWCARCAAFVLFTETRVDALDLEPIITCTLAPEHTHTTTTTAAHHPHCTPSPPSPRTHSARRLVHLPAILPCTAGAKGGRESWAVARWRQMSTPPCPSPAATPFCSLPSAAATSSLAGCSSTGVLCAWAGTSKVSDLPLQAVLLFSGPPAPPTTHRIGWNYSQTAAPPPTPTPTPPTPTPPHPTPHTRNAPRLESLQGSSVLAPQQESTSLGWCWAATPFSMARSPPATRMHVLSTHRAMERPGAGVSSLLRTQEIPPCWPASEMRKRYI